VNRCKDCRHWRPSDFPGPHVRLTTIPAGVRVQMWKRNPGGWNDSDGFATLTEPARRVTLSSGFPAFEATVEHHGRRFVHQFSGADDWAPFWELPEASGIERVGECTNCDVDECASGERPYAVGNTCNVDLMTRESFGCVQWEAKA